MGASSKSSDGAEVLQLVLVAGYGRSGSTILDRVLGHHPDVFAVGELVNVHRELWMADHFCGCGERGRACPFWGAVRERWLAGRGDGAIERFLELRGRAIGRVGQKRSVALGREERGELIGEMAMLYGAIAAVSGRQVIVDSSKFPGWVDLALRIRGAEKTVVHLVRDGRSVVASLRRPLAMDIAKGVQHDIPGKPALHSSLAWLVGNAATEHMTRRAAGQSMRITYEQLLSKPMATLTDLGRHVGVDFGEEARMIDEARSFPRTHAVAGGRVRMSESVVVDRRLLPAGLSPVEACTFWLTAGALAWRYGYRPLTRATRSPSRPGGDAEHG